MFDSSLLDSNVPLTPYGAWKIANAYITQEGFKSIPSQMLYNYTSGKLREGKKPLIKYSKEEGVDHEDFARWLSSYILKKKALATVV